LQFVHLWFADLAVADFQFVYVESVVQLAIEFFQLLLDEW
jgi:hypothetical protein